MSSPPRWPLAALTGVAGGAVTLGVAGVLAGLADLAGLGGGTPSPVVAVGGAAIDATPPWLKDWAIGVFGTSDKLALVVGMTVVLVLVCAALGVLGAPSVLGGRGRPRVGGVVFAALVAVGLVAVLLRPGAQAVDAVPTVVGGLVGGAALRWCWRSTGPRSAGPPLARRQVLRAALGLGVVGAALALGSELLLSARQRVEQARTALGIPAVADPVRVPAGAQVDVPQMTPYVTPSADFYRIDTALVPPTVDPSTWELRVHGMVEQEVRIDMAELLAQPMIESLTTLACVSNTVGGSLVGNAVWTGWPIRELLARAGPSPDADMVLSRSVDGFTASTPLEVLTDDRDAVLAVGMNGDPLPVEHGFPVRMVVPGLYGYVSATKWVTELKVTTFAADTAYWTPRGWSERGPVKTSSRIDVPRASAEIPAGTVVVAGVA